MQVYSEVRKDVEDKIKLNEDAYPVLVANCKEGLAK